MSEDATLDEFVDEPAESQDTQERPIPDGWQIARADEIMEITRGASPRPKGDPELFGGDIPWVKIGDVDVKNARYTGETEDTVTEKGSKKSKLVDSGTLLVSNSGTCGYPMFAGIESCVHDGWLILRDYEESLNPHYLYEFINWKQEYLKSLAPGSTQINLNTSRFGVLEINIPPLSEQRKIATVLHTVDRAIEKTEEIIEQVKKVKKGAMQELFNEGYYDHENKKDGTLRWQTVPASWKLPQLSELVDINPSHDEVDCLADYIPMDAVDTTLSDPQYIEKRNPSENSGRMFQKGDTLFARITPCTENGKICFVNELESDVGIGSTEYAVLSPSHKILPKYLYHYTRTHPVRNYSISRMRGSTGRQRVPFDVFRKELHIPLPSKEEQGAIVKCLDSFDHRIKTSQRCQAQLQRLKRGLMQDLLSGTVRTTDTNMEVPDKITQHG